MAYWSRQEHNLVSQTLGSVLALQVSDYLVSESIRALGQPAGQLAKNFQPLAGESP